jgi:hypothetical protein
MRRSKVDAAAYGPSLHDSESYLEVLRTRSATARREG